VFYSVYEDVWFVVPVKSGPRRMFVNMYYTQAVAIIVEQIGNHLPGPCRANCAVNFNGTITCHRQDSSSNVYNIASQE